AVKEQSHPDALRLALEAYYSFAAADPERVRNPYFYFVDFGLDNGTPRGYVFDMKALKLVEGPFTVAHGRGSSNGRNGVPTRFSNRPGSYATALGLYVTQESYTFTGKSGGRRYSSTGLRLAGVSGRFNDAARARGIVAHGAPYVTPGAAGRSEGCPAMEVGRARRLLPLIANGGVAFLYSPRDQAWLTGDPWISEYVATRSLAGRDRAGG
ncbi:MAG TPA: murein L,D-transpeptidase catalytic domain family protein, partial [Longimicrobiales bacterium]|nr:murein L,D-transpeptidase catalytic domain family protein [Longimicrobiales bacterium]